MPHVLPFLLAVAMSMDPLLNAMVIRDLIQYPDKTLYKAAALLKPEERPTVPVRLYDNPNDAYLEAYGPEVKPNGRARAFTNPGRTKIFVNRKVGDNRDKYKVAAMLAHEQTHIVGGPALNEEDPAYAKEVEVLRRFGRKIPPEYVDTMLQLFHPERVAKK